MAKRVSRDDELSKKPKVREDLLDVYKMIEDGFVDQRDRVDDIVDYWEAYNCELGERQFYNGTSQIYMPYIHDAVEARATRFTNQLFPQSGRFVDVTTEDGSIPHATIALIEHHVAVSKLRTEIVPSLVRNGDIEGQYNVYVGWKDVTKHLVSRVEKPLRAAGVESDALGTQEDIEEEEVVRGSPDIEVLHDSDVLILPATANSANDAIESGGWVVVARRWSKVKIKSLMGSGDIVKEEGEALIDAMRAAARDQTKNISKELAESAGVKAKGKHTLIYEAWGKISVPGEKGRRLVRVYFGGETKILGCKLCPYWCDEIPILSAPVRKTAGVAKGVPLIKQVIDIQIFANDTINEAADTAHFAAMPITMTDPEKNPKVGTMIMGLGAVWETSPRDTSFAQFPDLWRHGAERANECKNQIFQTLGVNPAMMPQQTGSKAGKRNQAEIAMEQQIDILTTADAVTNIEEQILTPLLQRIAAYDHQFREDDMLIRSYGELGTNAKMESIQPLQANYRYRFKWWGVEAARNAAMIQQQIAMINVIKGIPPQLYEGWKLQLAPAISNMVESAFGPRLGPRTFVDLSKQNSVDPLVENDMMEEGIDVMVHPNDDDQKHIQVHMAMMQGGDPNGVYARHIALHQHQIQAKNMAQAQAMQGGQGGGGGPQPGAQPGPQIQKAPPGAMHQDQMASAGAVTMPRKT